MIFCASFSARVCTMFVVDWQKHPISTRHRQHLPQNPACRRCRPAKQVGSSADSPAVERSHVAAVHADMPPASKGASWREGMVPLRTCQLWLWPGALAVPPQMRLPLATVLWHALMTLRECNMPTPGAMLPHSLQLHPRGLGPLHFLCLCHSRSSFSAGLSTLLLWFWFCGIGFVVPFDVFLPPLAKGEL